MKKFSKINENRISGVYTVKIDMKLDESTCNEILKHILRVYPNDKVLKLYGYDKAIHKYMTEYFKYHEMEIDTLIIEQLFLDDLSIDPKVIDNLLNRINTEDIKTK